MDQPSLLPVFQRDKLLKSQWIGKGALPAQRALPACSHSREGSGLGFQGKREELNSSSPLQPSIPTAPKNLPGHGAQTSAGWSLTGKEMPTSRAEARLQSRGCVTRAQLTELPQLPGLLEPAPSSVLQLQLQQGSHRSSRAREKLQVKEWKRFQPNRAE